MRVIDSGKRKPLTRAELRAACAAIGGRIDEARALIQKEKPLEVEASTQPVGSQDAAPPSVRTR